MDDFACFLEKNATHVVIPEWINKCARATDQPTLALCWPGMFEIARGKRCTIPTTGWVKRSKRTSEIMPLTFVKASESKVPFVQNAMKRRKETLDCILTESNVARFQSVSTTYPMNMILSSLMDQISLLYAESPIEPNDEWRSYSYKVISGRLRHLEFEVQNLPATLRRLGAIKGFGTSVMRWIGEYLNHNKCSLIQELESSDIRSSVRRLNHIWGVGPRKALSLVHLGYKNIEDIRAALKNGKLNLQANIRIGVDCYEDFLETMERDEVAIIGKIVEETILERFPEAHVCIMGSYRRGKSQCGDVDVLITHPQYIEAVPAGVIDWLVESLRLRGHISHHLTKVNIFHTNEDISNIESYDEDILDLGCSVSYMGVFLSPVHANKKRRIDIKFYPLNEQATAMLYFTGIVVVNLTILLIYPFSHDVLGSSYFNRSIRLYAKTVKKLHLDDHGIFHRSSTFGSEKKINVKTERDIFDLLGLEYKEPFERDSFDAVKIKGSSEPLFLSVTESEFD
jgi:DNA polymerase lambda